MEKVVPMQFSTWFQVTAKIIADRMILNAHLIEHPAHALDTRISILEEWKRSTDIE